jgi:hypothetical protein
MSVQFGDASTTDDKPEHDDQSVTSPSGSLPINGGTSEADGNVASSLTWSPALLALVRRTGYPLRQENGQRRYGPPVEWNGPIPGRGCEVFVGKLPRDCYEDELVPTFERYGLIYEVTTSSSSASAFVSQLMFCHFDV